MTDGPGSEVDIIDGSLHLAPEEISQLHVVDPHQAMREALLGGLSARQVAYRSGVVSPNWLAMHDWDYQPAVVVVRGAMRDVWPVLLKVRALVSLGCRPVVLLDRERYPLAVDRLLAAGAFAVCDTYGSLAQLTDEVSRALCTPGGTRRIGAGSESEPGLPVLSSRTLQVAGLYVSAQAPTSTEIGQALNIRSHTVRTHLERARTPYRELGRDVSTRSALRNVLLADGQLVGELGWYS